MDSCENFEIESYSFSACNNVVPKRYFSLYQQATGCTKPKKKRYHIDAKRSGQHGMKNKYIGIICFLIIRIDVNKCPHQACVPHM